MKLGIDKVQRVTPPEFSKKNNPGLRGMGVRNWKFWTFPRKQNQDFEPLPQQELDQTILTEIALAEICLKVLQNLKFLFILCQEEVIRQCCTL